MVVSRTDVVQAKVNRTARQVEYPKDAHGVAIPLSELYGEKVFGNDKLAKTLPKPIYKEFMAQGRDGKNISKGVSDAIAHAARVWAMENGATHFTHWFQPQTDSTAEKHDTFLTMDYKITQSGLQVTPMDALSGSQLVQAEPDASSFPHGGMRTTFEARGYTVWDRTSPMFIQEGPHGTSILYIPSIFIGYNGEALDEKTVLLRSNQAIADASLRLLKLCGDTTSTRVFVTLGTEQEYFLVDRGLYQLRPDLKLSGRTLVGKQPPKHQQLEDHYFGRIPSRALAVMSEAELELWQLGVPVKTRHNEVAPAQFELAPVFEEVTVAVDHNLLTMDVLHKVAHRHKLKCLFHEKPFKGVNGSGKHCNWSLSTDTGVNLLDPTEHPETNYTFLIILVAILDAVHRHGGLLRCSVASASNDCRLGAHEAPPGIISAFLGAHLTEVLDSIEEGRDFKPAQSSLQTVKLNGSQIDVKIKAMPEIARDTTDRNRTSPFAFTGNKFEFRAVGSKQTPSFPCTLLNSAIASSFHRISDALEARKGSKALPSKEDYLAVIKEFTIMSKPVRFEGNNYSDEWVAEAAKRGLPNIRYAPDAFKQLLEPVNATMLATMGVFYEAELHSRYHIMNEKYAKDLLIEANSLVAIMSSGVLPAVFKYRKELATSAKALDSLPVDSSAEKSALNDLSPLLAGAQAGVKALKEVIAVVEADIEDAVVVGQKAVALLDAMEKVRDFSDEMEPMVADEYWPFPKYQEMLFTV